MAEPDGSPPQPVDVAGLVDAIGDAVVVSDPSGAIVVWNAAATRLFGHSADEAMGQSLDLITPERQRRRHWDGYFETMRTGITKYGADVLRVPAIHKDGRALSIAFTVGMLHGPDGRVTGIAAIIRDETRRWTEERDLRRRVAELESRVPSRGAVETARPGQTPYGQALQGQDEEPARSGPHRNDFVSVTDRSGRTPQ